MSESVPTANEDARPLAKEEVMSDELKDAVSLRVNDTQNPVVRNPRRATPSQQE
jgi:hypothetical protein